MKEYIEREVAIKIVDNIDTFCGGWRYSAMDQIKAMSKADVKEVLHAHWINVQPAPWHTVYATCSNCKRRMTLDDDITRISCPNCGATMDESEE